MRKGWISWILILVFSGSVFADRQKKTVETLPALSEEKRLEFDYSFMEGVKCKILGDFQEALGWFDNCLKLLPSSPVVKYEVAALLLAAKDYNGALALIREAVAGNPENVWYRILLANVLREKSMIEEACAVYADIIAKYPDREEFYLLEAGLYASVEKWQKAIDVCDRYEAYYGITEPVSIEKIKLYTKLDDVKGASNELMKLIRRYPDRSDYLNLLAELYFNYNQDKKGLQILDRLLKAEPENGFVHFYLADYYLSKNRPEEADAHIRSGLVSDKMENGYKVQYILRLILSADTVEMPESRLDAYMELLMEKYSDDLSVRALHSDFLKKDGKLEESKKELEYILSKEKDNYLIWEELLLLCNELQDTAGTYRLGLEAMTYFPDQPLPYALVGLKFMLDNDFGQALPFLEKGVALADDNSLLKAQFYSYLGDCYYRLDRAEEAFRMFDEVLRIHPNDVLVLNNYAYYLALRKENLSRAEQMISQAVKLESDNAVYLDTYAWVLYVRGNYSQARFYMKLAIEKSGEDSGVYYDHYGDILYRNGDKAEAMEMWRKASELGLEDGEMSEKLKKKLETGVLPD